MEITVNTTYSYGDTVYYLSGTEIKSFEVNDIVICVHDSKQPYVNYWHNHRSFEEDELYPDAQSIINKITSSINNKQ